jgi:oligosaccharide repeat unit polymerase
MLYIYITYFLISKKVSNIVVFLLALIIISYIAAIVIGKLYVVEDLIDVLHIIFTATILLIFIHGFNNYKNLTQIDSYYDNSSFHKLIKILIFIGLVTFLINAFITYKAFNALIAETVVVEEYKNEGGAASYLETWVNPSILFLSRLLSPIGYFSLGLHFFFLAKREKMKTFIFFLISLNIPLLGFHGLSRSAAVQFLLVYFFYLLYSLPSLSKKVKRRFIVFGGIFLIGAVFLLNIITTSRFESYYNIPIESSIQNNELYSVFDYASQWNQNGIVVMDRFSYDKLMYGKSTTPIIEFVGERIGLEVVKLPELRFQYLGDDYDHTFNGVVATLLYDFGYVFTFLFALLFYKIVKKNAPVNGVISLDKFISFAYLIPLPLMFFSNNVYSNLSMNLGVIYFLIITFFLKRSKK